MKIKIFCIYYYKSDSFYKTDCVEPIYAGNHYSSINDHSILRDDFGINITDKNYNYGELTTHYWVWKNYIEKNPNLEYIGFCHYRRFLDFEKPASNNKCFHTSVSFKNFNKNFSSYTESNIYPIIKDYDVILPEKHIRSNYIYYDNLNKYPSKINVDLALDLIKSDYPEYWDIANHFFFNKPHEKYLCLTFLMKKEIFLEYSNWIFEVLGKLEKKFTKDNYTSSRQFAFLAEQFFTIWLNKKIETSNIKILNRKSVRLRSTYDRLVRNLKRTSKKIINFLKGFFK